MPSYHTDDKIYEPAGGTAMYVADGGRIAFESGASGRYMTGSTLNVTGATLIGFTGITGTIAPGSVGRTQLNAYFSPVLAGSGGTAGAFSTIAHGLGVNPGATGVFFSVFNANADSNYEFTNLSTDATNVYVRADDDILFRMQVWAP